ncbi:MAG: peptide chain release factor N(5)-glutamine methyltransferase [Clostridia bacterium]|nr:peptide chain release factor N(5)-glutamine methyltransferase [Clostridia bacterium]
MNGHEAFKRTAKKLHEAGIASARFEAAQLIEYLKDDMEEVDFLELSELVERRLSGEPLQYVLGIWEFYSLPFYVGPGVLIPRPDTEHLCDTAIEFIGERELKVIDLCSGSGCVAVAIDKNCKNARVEALEKYPEAYSYLERNIQLNRSRVRPRQGDIELPGEGKYDVIVSNPPYIRPDEMASLEKEVLFEPHTALFGGEDGLYFYRKILENWLPSLNAGGLLAVEIGYSQGKEVAKLFREAGLSNVGIRCDYGKNERVVFGTLKNI